MRTRFLLAFAAFAGLACGPAIAAGPDAAAIATRGNGAGVPPCASCHGADGMGQAAAGFPRLAGLDAAYIRRQLDAFADGLRDNPVMRPLASALDKDQRRALSVYYSRLPLPAKPATSTPTATTALPAQDALGLQLAVRGLWSKQVPACVACHGPHGIGVGEHFPPLAGQPATYIANQLHGWQQGKRKNDPLGLMQHISDQLDDADIKAVSAWFAAQPVQPGGQP